MSFNTIDFSLFIGATNLLTSRQKKFRIWFDVIFRLCKHFPSCLIITQYCLSVNGKELTQAKWQTGRLETCSRRAIIMHSFGPNTSTMWVRFTANQATICCLHAIHFKGRFMYYNNSKKCWDCISPANLSPDMLCTVNSLFDGHL